MTTTYTARDRRPAPSVRVSRGRSDLLFAPDLLFAAATLWALHMPSPSTGLAVISVIACLFGASSALRRGGPYLLPSSVFFVAAGVFIGIAGYYLGRVGSDVAMVDVRNAAGLAMLSTLGISIVVMGCSVAWRLRWTLDGVAPTSVETAFTPPSQFVLKAGVMIVLSQMPIVGAWGGALATAIGLTGIMMLALIGSTRRTKVRWVGDFVVVGLVVAAPVFWLTVEFSGGGRLVVAGMLVAAFMGWNMVRPHRLQKVAVILSIPVFLLFAGMNRLEHRSGTEGVDTTTVVADGKGLGSVYSPLRTFGQILEPKPPETMELLGPRYGETFFNTLVLWVPRDLWEDKPIGFGRELVIDLEVERTSRNHSMAALFQGEWYANFGYAGLVMMVPVTGVLLALLDRAHNRIIRARMGAPRDWWRAVALLCAVSSLADLFWVGSFMWFARGGLAAIVTLVLARLSLRRVAATRRVRRRSVEGAEQEAEARMSGATLREVSG